MKVISVFSEKGGVGKTTITSNLGTALARKNYKVLILDMDPQGHIANLFGVEPERRRILQFLVTGTFTDDIIKKTRIENLYIISSDWSLADFTVNVARHPDRHLKLRRIVDKIKDKFNIVMIDPPPSLELITLNVLLASEGVIIPVALTYLGLAGAAETLKIVAQTRKAFNYAPGVIALVPNMYEDTLNCKELLERLKAKVGKHVSKTIIHRDPEVDRAQSFSMTVLELNPNSQAAKDFEKLADELILRLGI